MESILLSGKFVILKNSWICTSVNCHTSVVIDKDEVVACGGYDREDNIATLSWGMVECSRHGESIGKYLLLHRLNGIRKDYGSITVKIYTSQHTQGFYQKYSFVPTSVEKNGYKEGLDKVYMEL